MLSGFHLHRPRQKRHWHGVGSLLRGRPLRDLNPGWDYAMAYRLIAWLDHCGYAIVEKDAGHKEASLAPEDSEVETSRRF